MLVRDVYPLEVAELYYELELFLQEAEDASDPGPPLRVSSLVRQNLATAGRRQAPESNIGPETLAVDVVATFDPGRRVTEFGFARQPGSLGRVFGAPHLRVAVPCEVGITRTIALPLQILLAGWGDVSRGYWGAVHGIDILHPTSGKLLERWRLALASDLDWLAPMERQERAVRAGADRRYRAA